MNDDDIVGVIYLSEPHRVVRLLDEMPVPELPAIASRTALQLLATASDVYEWISAIWRPIEKGVS